MDLDHPENHHFDYKQENKKEETDNIEFEINADDKRFNNLFISPHFAIDPSSSQFKKTKNMKNVLKLQTSKRKRMY
ncbi:hypothetical protein HZS_33 [Henneguya salminicola]|nr:hypothetical protein HZS_33 [Henneguya salminicola]